MRICVKGLPKTATEAQLRAHFSELGEIITDAKIAKTRAGVSRQFAFVGFKTDAAAVAAVKRFNKSFMGTSRLVVEPAAEIDDATRVKLAWSRHTKQKQAAAAKPSSSPSTTSNPASVRNAAPAGVKVKDATRLQEYVALATRAAKGPSWADGTVAGPEGAKDKRMAVSSSQAALREADDDGNSTDSEEYQDAPMRDAEAAVNSAVPGLPVAASKRSSRAVAAESTARASDDVEMTSSLHDADSHAVVPGVNRALAQSDADFLRSHTVRGHFSDSEDDDEVDGSSTSSESSTSSSESSDKSESESSDDEEEEERRRAAEKGARQHGATPAGGAEGATTGNTQGWQEDGQEGHQPQQKPAADADADAGEADSEGGSNEDVGETGRLFVRNLPYSATDAEVAEYFGRWGATADVRVLKDGRGRPTGCAYVLYVLPEHAVSALAASDGRPFQGRLLHTLPARPVPADHAAKTEASAAAAAAAGAAAAGAGSKQSQYQRTADEKKRRAAGTAAEGAVSGNPWSALFVRADTTVAAIAAQLGIGRSELLLGSSGSGGDDAAAAGERGGGGASAAVRLALAETELISQTQRFLAAEGVDVGALEAAMVAPGAQARSRSDRVLLVKNLPWTTDCAALRELFGRHGALARFVMPPTRALAIAEYIDPRQARRAFAALAYTRYQRAPLYLEWAPEALFERAAQDSAAASDAAGASNPPSSAGALAGASAIASAAAAPLPQPQLQPAPSAAPAPDASATTLFIKNVSFASTEEGLRGMFGVLGPLRAVRIPKRRNPRYRPLPTAAGGGDAATASATAGKPLPPPPPGGSGATGVGGQPEFLSMGYGFVEFERAADAAAALRALQGRELDGHALQLKISTAAAAAVASASGGAAVAAGGTLDPAAGAALAAVSAAGKKGKAAARAAAAAASAATPAAVGTPTSSTAPTAAASAGSAGSSSSAAAPSGGATTGPAASTKLLVRNLAFEATVKDVRALFAGFGTLRSVRLPKKFDGSHRGFGFVDFLTRQEAATAKAALAATHLYGRHLVVEWAAATAQGDAGAAGAGGGTGTGAGLGVKSGKPAAQAAGAVPSVAAVQAASSGTALAGSKRARQG